MCSKKRLTTSWGAPVTNNQNSITAGNNGPALLQDVHLIDKLAHFNRERIPERVIHAKGAGAHGYFEVTTNLTDYTKAAFLSEVGKRTPVFARFSTVIGESGSADTVRDARGFAIKFYTEEGNYDLVGNNSPIFFIRDAMKFPDFIHSQRKNPVTNLRDPNAVWDFLSFSPEALHQITILMSDRGIPASYRHMHGYGCHTFLWTNNEGESVWVKYHLQTEQGIKNLSEEEALTLAAKNPDYMTEELYKSIESGNVTSWKMFVQIMPLQEAHTYRYNPFDVTKIWHKIDYPLIEVGRLVLNKNPHNYFTEVEQSTFSPGNFVPGIGPSPDKLLQGRIFAYPDAHRYRVGVNHHHLPINRPHNAGYSCQQNGAMRYEHNFSINYEPNSFADSQTKNEPQNAPSFILKNKLYDENDHYSQAGHLYRKLNEAERSRLISTIVYNIKKVQKEEIVIRMIEHFFKVDQEYGNKVAEGLSLPIPNDIFN